MTGKTANKKMYVLGNALYSVLFLFTFALIGQNLQSLYVSENSKGINEQLINSLPNETKIKGISNNQNLEHSTKVLGATSQTLIVSSSDLAGGDCVKSLRNHSQTNINNTSNWLNFNFDDSSWSCAQSVWPQNTWGTCKQPDGINQWYPKEVDGTPDAPTNCLSGFTFVEPNNRNYGTKVINAGGGATRPSMEKDFFRKKFTLPANAKVISAKLYVSSDNLAIFWINGNNLNNGATSLNNGGICGDPIAGTTPSDGGIFSYDIANLLISGNNIFAANLLNTKPCGRSHPMGIQFTIKVIYDEVTNGSCGLSYNTCTSGTLEDINDNDATRPAKYLWNCLGLNSGSTANCTYDKPQCEGFNIYDGTKESPNWISGSIPPGKPSRNLSDTITVRVKQGGSNLKKSLICWSADGMQSAEYLKDASWKCSAEILTGSGFVTKKVQEFINEIPSPTVKTSAQTNGLVFVTNGYDSLGGSCSTNPGYTDSSTFFHPGSTRSADGRRLAPKTQNHVCGSTSSTICKRSLGINSVINGVCGPANGQSFTSIPTTDLCTAGTPTTVSGYGPWDWNCSGSGDGSTARCSANKTAEVNGTCGLAHGQSFTSKPTTDLCTTGTPTTVLGTGPWDWNCSGSGGGLNASCRANKTAVVHGTCGPANGGSFTSIPTTNLCTAGTPTTVLGTGPWNWTCSGSGGGLNVDCNANISIDTFSININYGEIIDTKVITSKDFTLSTNYIPKYIQSGAAYSDSAENPKLNMDEAIGQNPITNSTALCSGNSGCSLGPVSGTNKFGGANSCFSGDSTVQTDITYGEPDNPITYWFEYEDQDNYLNPSQVCRINEFNSHKLALVPKGIPGISYTVNEVSDNADLKNRSNLYIEYNFKQNKLETDSSKAKGHDKVTISPLIKFDSQNKVRIGYKLEFGQNFAPGSYDIFALVTSEINDPRANIGGTLLYDNPIFPHSGKFTKVGEWTIDTTPPEVQQPTFGNWGIDSFNINWNIRSNLELLDLNLGCYSSDQSKLNTAGASILGYFNPTSFNAALHNPFSGSFMDTFNTANRPECSPEGTTNLKARVNGSLNTNQLMRTRHKIAEPADITYFKAKGRAVDKACNNVTTNPGETTLPISNNWVSTVGGSFMSDNIAIENQSNLSSQGHNLYCNYDNSTSTNNEILYSKVNSDILSLSSNTILSVDSALASIEKSLITAVGSSYIDDLDRELTQMNRAYFDVLEDKLTSNQLFDKIISGNTIVDSVSQLHNCDDNESCYIKVNGDLTINGSDGMDGRTACNDKNMILVEGNLLVNHNLTKSSPGMCCAFVVRGNINFDKPLGASPKDEKKYNAANAVEKTNWINTSQYDCGTGFFYTEGGNISIQRDSTNYGIDNLNENFADAFSVFGQLITRNGNIVQNRSNGLRNTLQPPVFIYQDSCIYRNFKAASEVFVSTRDITY